MSEQEARAYPVLFERLVLTVKPHRDSLTRQVHERCFWKHWDRREELYVQLGGLTMAIVCPEVSKHCCFEFVSTDVLFSHMVNVIASESIELLSVLQSEFHVQWAWQYGSTMRNAGIRYTASDCFYTFPLPVDLLSLTATGTAFHFHRRVVMDRREEGLTKIYNRFHDSAETAEDIRKLRELHVEIDRSVSTAYGWTGLDLGHGFHQTKQGIRFTLSEPARREVLARLLKLNHERYEEEVRQGLHVNKKAKVGKQGKRDTLTHEIPGLSE